VTDPVSLLPTDNNGVVVELPSIANGGVTNVPGYLVLGIATQTNNQPSGVTTFQADDSAEFSTNFANQELTSFLDTGSNGLYLDSSNTNSLIDCGSTNQNESGFFCPGSLVTLSAVNSGVSGSPSSTVEFQIGNYDTLLNNASANVYVEMGGYASGLFDWGLPFFLGRNVYVGFSGTSSSLGTGPYWSY
jgi:hypothetical protein